MPIATEYLLDTPAGRARAAALLGSGRLVAFATETVYGLGADATDARAVAGIFAAKGRPRFNPLIAHYPDAAAAFAHVAADARARSLAAAFWPGALTLVLPRAAACPVAEIAGAGLPSLAVRVPSHDGARALLRAIGRPVAAPSANPSGRVSPTTAAHVLEGLYGRIDAVLEGGACPVGVESTVLDLTGAAPRLLRPGGIPREAIEAAIGPLAIANTSDDNAPRAPGMLSSHYAPSLPLRLDARAVGSDEALLAFGPPLPGARMVFNLSPEGDLTEAAARLFAGLRSLDRAALQAGCTAIAAMAVPGRGLGLAINDRLARAAAPRPAGTEGTHPS
ncbi:MAG: threonylcarbamoyl-AMP synthase [Rhodospirillales bacterium]|nr:threonylcarbamoyl-AMP synthase [Rhodospirillales bacterium]